MPTQKVVSKLTTAQRRMLTDHVAAGGPVPCSVSDSKTLAVLLGLKLIRSVHPHDRRMRATTLTTKGRRAACMVLAEYAETLIRAGAGRSPLEQILTEEREQELKKFIGDVKEHFEAFPQVVENIDPVDYAAE